MDDLRARRSVFITGCGGVGKTFFISAGVRQWCEQERGGASGVVVVVGLVQLRRLVHKAWLVCVYRLDSLRGHSAHLPRRSKSSSGC